MSSFKEDIFLKKGEEALRELEEKEQEEKSGIDIAELMEKCSNAAVVISEAISKLNEETGQEFTIESFYQTAQLPQCQEKIIRRDLILTSKTDITFTYHFK